MDNERRNEIFEEIEYYYQTQNGGLPEEWAEEIKDMENDEDSISDKLGIVVGHITCYWEDTDGVRFFLRIMGASEDEIEELVEIPLMRISDYYFTMGYKR